MHDPRAASHDVPRFRNEKRIFFGKSGRALITACQFNPLKIVRDGKAAFNENMKSDYQCIHLKSINKIYDRACESVKKGLHDRRLAALSINLSHRWEDLFRNLERKVKAGEAMRMLYQEARTLDP